MGNDVKNKSVVRIYDGHKKYVKAVKITDNGLINCLTYLKQKQGKKMNYLNF